MVNGVLYLIAKWEIMLFLFGLTTVIAYKLMTGKINTHYLLYGTRGDGTRYFSPERVQLLVATMGVAMQYLMQSMHTAAGAMPKLPDGTLQLLGISNAVYLGGKALAFTKKAITSQGVGS